jgi:hypothetical protein
VLERDEGTGEILIDRRLERDPEYVGAGDRLLVRRVEAFAPDFRFSFVSRVRRSSPALSFPFEEGCGRESSSERSSKAYFALLRLGLSEPAVCEDEGERERRRALPSSLRRSRSVACASRGERLRSRSYLRCLVSSGSRVRREDRAWPSPSLDGERDRLRRLLRFLLASSSLSSPSHVAQSLTFLFLSAVLPSQRSQPSSLSRLLEL